MSTESKPTQEKREQTEYETAAFLFNVVEAQITRADTKAGLVVAADSVFATALLLVSRGSLLALFDGGAPVTERLSAVVFLGVFILLLCSTLFSLFAARPALQAPDEESTLFFFGRISRLKRQQFVESFNLQETAQHRHAILTEIHNTSRIAARKFRLIRFSIDFLIAAVSLWVIIQVLFGLTP